MKDEEYIDLRKEMVEKQIHRRGISSSRVRRAMVTVPRHRFVAERYRSSAYADHPLPIGEGQTISQPYIVAYMTDALDIADGMKVLEIGSGCGYQSAILCEMGAQVFAVERLSPILSDAEQRLATLGYAIHSKIGDGHLGWPEEAPFERIIVAAAPEEVPPALVDQLAETGRLVIPVGSCLQELLVLEKRDGEMVEVDSLGVRFVPLVKD